MIIDKLYAGVKSLVGIATMMLSLLVILSCEKNVVEDPLPTPVEPFFIRGLDLSFAPEISSYNISFFDDTVAKPLLQLVKEKGINTIRLRLWHSPATVHSSLGEVLDFAKQVKQEGLKIWLDFHYSDIWADPGHQQKPDAWDNLNFDQLKDSIYTYTKNTLTTFSQNNVTPDFVQVGNETNNGMLWEDGKIYTASGENWSNFTALTEQAIAAIKEVSTGSLAILHYAGYTGAVDYFENLTALQPDFDIIAISYYPPWHGKNTDSLADVMSDLSIQFQKPVVIAETSYPWTLGWNDWTNNLVGLNNQLIPAYPATAEGQANFISELVSITKSVSNVSNSGVCYWAPDWVAFKGTIATDGSPWENQTLFDFQYRALPALDTLGTK